MKYLAWLEESLRGSVQPFDERDLTVLKSGW